MYKKVIRTVGGFACFCDLCGRESESLMAYPVLFCLREFDGWLEKQWLAKKRQDPRDMYERYHFCPDCAKKIAKMRKKEILSLLKEKGKQ